jgi:hypothetical protein
MGPASLLPFARLARLPVGRAHHRRNTFIDRRVQLCPGGFTKTGTGFKPAQQLDETRGQRLHEIVPLAKGLSELVSYGALVTTVSEVAGAWTSAVLLLLHGATRYAGWMSMGNAALPT